MPQTHIFLVRTCAGTLYQRARVGSRMCLECLSLCVHQKSFVRIMFRRTLLGVLDPFPSFPSTPPPTQPSLLQTGMSVNSCADPRRGLLFGRMAEQRPLIEGGRMERVELRAILNAKTFFLQRSQPMRSQQENIRRSESISEDSFNVSMKKALFLDKAPSSVRVPLQMQNLETFEAMTAVTLEFLQHNAQNRWTEDDLLRVRTCWSHGRRLLGGGNEQTQYT